MPRYISAIPQYFDDGGEPLIGGKLYFYESGTSTPIDLFYDVNLTIAAPNPAILSGSGRVPNIFFNGIAKVILKDSADVQIWEADPVGDAGSTSSFENWSNLIVYGINDVVQGTDFELYASIISGNINNDPVTTPSAWEGVEFVSKWNEFVSYDTSDIAKASNGFIYRSLQDNNLGNDPLTSPTFWGGTQAQDIPDASIELTKMVHMTAPNMIGRNTVGAGPQEELTPTQVRANINVEDGATANSTDAFLLDRANHTGTQTLATISDAGTLAGLNSVSSTEIDTDAVGSDEIAASAVGTSELDEVGTAGTATYATVTTDVNGRVTALSSGTAPVEKSGLYIVQIVAADSPVTADVGKAYQVDASAGAVTINMPEIVNEPEEILIDVVDATNDTTIVPFAGDSVTTSVIDAVSVRSYFADLAGATWRDVLYSAGSSGGLELIQTIDMSGLVEAVLDNPLIGDAKYGGYKIKLNTRQSSNTDRFIRGNYSLDGGTTWASTNAYIYAAQSYTFQSGGAQVLSGNDGGNIWDVSGTCGNASGSNVENYSLTMDIGDLSDPINRCLFESVCYSATNGTVGSSDGTFYKASMSNSLVGPITALRFFLSGSGTFLDGSVSIWGYLK